MYLNFLLILHTKNIHTFGIVRIVNMKKLFSLSALLIMSLVVFAADGTYNLMDVYGNQTIATFVAADENITDLSCEFTLPDGVTNIAVVYTKGSINTWYGPEWDGLKSTLADSDGYCWWTPTFNEQGVATATLTSTSGMNNHIGMVFPAGKFRISMHTVNATFRIEKLETAAVENIAEGNSRATKCIKNGQVVIIRDGRMYNLLGAELL